MFTKRFFLFVLMGSMAFFACKKVDIRFGDQFLDNGYTQIVKVDSFSVDVSTVYVDSFLTSGKGVAVIGAYADPVFGKIDAQTYLEVIPPAYQEGMADSFQFAMFDSIALVLRPDKSWFGDTTKAIQLTVDRLAEPIVSTDNSALAIYNTRSFLVQPTPLGTRNIVLRPNAGDSILVRLNDALGNDLLKKMQNPNDADLKTSDAFLQYFYGLRLHAAANSNLIFGSKDSVTMRLYYKKPGLYLTSRTFDFSLASKSHQFNNITVDRTGTPLEKLPVAKQFNSSVTANTAYTMYAAGAMAKIRFPTIRDVLKLPNYAKIIKATLLIRPLHGTYGTGSYVLPPSIRLSQTTQLNQIGNDIAYLSSNGNVLVQTGGLQVDDLYGESTSYSYDLTNYIKSIIQDATINQNGLLVLPPSPALETQFGRLVMGNKNNTAGKMELQLVYASVQ